MKKFLYLILILVFGLCLFAYPLSAQDTEKVNIYFFWQQGCPHCADEKPFLVNLSQDNPNINLYDFDISSSRASLELLIEIGDKLDIDIPGVPFTLVGEKYFIGWYNEQVTGNSIKIAVDRASLGDCRDIVYEINHPDQFTDADSSSGDCEQPDKVQPIPETIDVPIIGQIKIKNLSLPVLTVILGALDGFNPCAMWVLLFLISLLLGMKDRKRMWILGTVFIVASSAVYFLFMAAWLNLLLFLGFVFWIRIIIGIVALGYSYHNLKEYFTNKAGVCQVTGTENRQKIFGKLRYITEQRNFIIALGGIILLAFAVNLVELICSAGLPAIYTQILTLTELPKIKYYLYILLYIVIFMLDDLVVFILAMITFRISGLTAKYSRWSHLIGGILMLIVGALLIFKPELLMFG